MDIFPVVCALLGFVLMGPSDAKVVTLNLGYLMKPERKNFYGTCNGPCGQVNVTDLSGNLRLFLAKEVIPVLQYSGGAVGCQNCLNEVNLVNLANSSSFGLSVQATKSSNQTVKVEVANLKNIKERIFPSKTVKFGTLQHMEAKVLQFKCTGPCQQLLAYVTYSTGLVHWFLQVKKPIRGTGSAGMCVNCFCLRTIYGTGENTCQFQSIDSWSFYVLVTGYQVQKDVTLTVEALNLDLGLDKSTTKSPLPSKLLNLTSSRVGERKNFYATCNGQCSLVTVTIESGNPLLYLAEGSIPFLQWTGCFFGGPKCQNCLKQFHNLNFKSSHSFGLTVVKTTSSDKVKVEAANLNDTEERIFPSKTLDIGFLFSNHQKTYKFACHGPCNQVRVEATASPKIPQWFVDPTHRFASWICEDCVCRRTITWYRNTCLELSFGSSTFSVRVYGSDVNIHNTKLKVQASNLVV